MRAGTRDPDRRLSDRAGPTSPLRAGHTDALGADTGYTARFPHNPLSDRYETCVGREAPYSLDEFAYYVDLAGGLRQKEKKPPAGIGPNVETFDRLQRWAYRRGGGVAHRTLQSVVRRRAAARRGDRDRRDRSEPQVTAEGERDSPHREDDESRQRPLIAPVGGGEGEVTSNTVLPVVSKAFPIKGALPEMISRPRGQLCVHRANASRSSAKSVRRAFRSKRRSRKAADDNQAHARGDPSAC